MTDRDYDRVEVAMNVVLPWIFWPVEFVTGLIRFTWKSLPKLASIAAIIVAVQQVR